MSNELETTNLILYHVRSGLDPSELRKADYVDTETGLLLPLPIKPGPELLGRVDSIRNWYISEQAHNDISFEAVFDMDYDYPFRFAYMEGGCDYTGWGCQSGASIILARKFEDLVRMGMTKEARERWGYKLQERP